MKIKMKNNKFLIVQFESVINPFTAFFNLWLLEFDFRSYSPNKVSLHIYLSIVDCEKYGVCEQSKYTL